MRTLNDHVVNGDKAGQLSVVAIDPPGEGGASHLYTVNGFNAGSNTSYPQDLVKDQLTVLFQNGPIQAHGVNGVTQEALLTIIIDRLRSFQNGPYSCRENAIALTHCEEALMWLQRRTVDRIKRGVEGVNKT